MTHATVDDVAVRLGRPITEPVEIAQVTAWLGDAQTIIRSRIPNIDDAVTEPGEPSEATVVMVESNAVVRKVHNPQGKSQERIDDYSYGYTGDAAHADVYLTDDEWDLLQPGSAEGAFTIHPYASRTWPAPDPWMPLR